MDTRRSTDPGETESAQPPWGALPVLLIGTFLIVLDFFVVNVALPSIQHDLDTSSTTVEWVVAGYGLAFAVFLLPAGHAADRIGRRTVYQAGTVVFVICSTLCGAAPNGTVLVAARLGQGVGAALISPTVLSLIGVLFPGAHRATAINAYGIVLGVGTAMGQILGGLLVSADVVGLGWRIVFFLNVPLGVVAIALSVRLVTESRALVAERFDFAGTVLVLLAMTAVVLPLLQGRELGWPVWIVAVLASSPVLVIITLRHQVRMSRRRTRAPLLDVVALRVPALRAGLVCQLAFWSTQAALFLLAAIYLQRGRGLSPLEAGLVFTAMATGFLATSSFATKLTRRIGTRLIVAGSGVVATGDLLMIVSAHAADHAAAVRWAIAALAVAGAGQGMCITPLTSAVIAHADPSRAGAVAGMLSTMQQLGNSLGIAVSGLIFFGTLASGYPGAVGNAFAELIVVLVLVAILAIRLGRLDAPLDPRPARATEDTMPR